MAIKDLMKPKAGKTAPEDARATVERLAQAEREWALIQREKLAALATLEAEAGALMLAANLEGRAGPDLAPRIVPLRTEADMAARTAAAARAERLAAISACYRVEAAELRAQAAALKADLSKRMERTTALLAQLREHEQCDYAPAPWIGPDGSQGWYHPQSDLLAFRVADLESMASAADNRRVNMTGSAQGDSPLALLDAALADPLTVAPPINDILDWAEQQVASEKKRRASYPENSDEYRPEGTPIPLSLTWRDGRISPGESRVLPTPAPPKRDPTANWPAPRTVHVGGYGTVN